MMRRSFATLVLTLAAAAVNAGDPVDARSVADTQSRRFQAMVDADAETLDALLADDLVYIHTTGAIDTKASLIDSIVSGRIDYVQLASGESQQRVIGDAVVVTGTAQLAVVAGGAEHALTIRYTEVYIPAGDGWRLASWQSTRVP